MLGCVWSVAGIWRAVTRYLARARGDINAMWSRVLKLSVVSIVECKEMGNQWLIDCLPFIVHWAFLSYCMFNANLFFACAPCIFTRFQSIHHSLSAYIYGTKGITHNVRRTTICHRTQGGAGRACRRHSSFSGIGLCV